MSLDVTDDGRYRHVTCGHCGAIGPKRHRAGDARRAARLEGWGRGYPGGRGEAFTCPTHKGQSWAPPDPGVSR